MKKSLLSQILKECRDSLPNHPQFSHFPHWTYFVRDNEILTVGLNRSLEPSKKYGYHDNPDPTFKPKYHSELDALRKCNRGLHDLDVVNVRLNKAGQLRLSLPCRTCRNLLALLDVRRVYFTTEVGWGVIKS